jgi:hypothetical protein
MVVLFGLATDNRQIDDHSRVAYRMDNLLKDHSFNASLIGFAPAAQK